MLNEIYLFYLLVFFQKKIMIMVREGYLKKVGYQRGVAKNCGHAHPWCQNLKPRFYFILIILCKKEKDFAAFMVTGFQAYLSNVVWTKQGSLLPETALEPKYQNVVKNCLPLQ